jgi:Uma2 family endonuclease
MRTEITKRLFTVDDYYRMAEAGILRDDDRVELINGEIVEMSPIGNRHAGCVNRASHVFMTGLGDKVVVAVQNPVHLNNYNEPQPDIVVAKPKADFYSSRHPSPDDVLLMIEVADTTLRKDRNLKLPVYAALGIREVWIEDLKHNVILVCRDLADKKYSTPLSFRRGESLSPSAFPELVVAVDDLLG